MTEAEWLACTDPRLMLNALHGQATERKPRLFACACCRLVWHLLPGLCHRLVEAVEQYADKEITTSDLLTLFDGYYPHQVAVSAVPGGNQAAEAVGCLGWRWRWGTNAPGWQDWDTSCRVARSAAESLAKSMPWQEARHWEGQLLHDMLGNPFHPAAADPAWIAWNDGTVPKLAQAIYEERRFQDMPILADALEEAGCTNADILSHCRQPGKHVRGCWVVDSILGKT
jgi:hypothetical protein